MGAALLFGMFGFGADAASAAGSITPSLRKITVPTTAVPSSTGSPGRSAMLPSTSATIRQVRRGTGAAYRPANDAGASATSTSGNPTRVQRAALVGLALVLPLVTWLVMAARENWRRRRR